MWPVCPSSADSRKLDTTLSAWTSRPVNCPLLGLFLPAIGWSRGDVTDLPLACASFDAVVSFYAVTHVPRQEHRHLFEETCRVLRPGGRTLLCLGWGGLPADSDPQSRLGVPMFSSHFDEKTNLVLLAETGLAPQWSRQVTDPMGHASHQFVLASRD
jgi:SAM-dependent methyltransferase